MPSVMHEPQFVTTGKPSYDELAKQNKRLEEAYQKQHEELTRLKTNIEPLYELVNEINAHLIMTRVVKD